MDISDFFKKIISSIIPKSKANFSVGVDIGSSSIKIVQFSVKNGKLNLDTYGSIALGPYVGLPIGAIAENITSEKITEALKTLVKEINVDPRNLGVALPTKSSFFRDIKVPATLTDEELKTVITTEAHKVIPVPLQDVEIDWLPIPGDIMEHTKDEIPKKDLLLIAISKDSQKKIESYLSPALLSPTFYELEVFSMMRVVYTHEKAPIVLIDLGAKHIKVVIIHEGSVRRAVSLDRGFNELDMALMNQGMDFINAHNFKHQASIVGMDPNETLMRNAYLSIMRDIEAVLSEYEKYSHTLPVGVVLLGGGAEMSGIVELTQNTLGFPVSKSKPFDSVVVPDLVKDVIPNIEPEFTIVSGIAIRLLNS